MYFITIKILSYFYDSFVRHELILITITSVMTLGVTAQYKTMRARRAILFATRFVDISTSSVKIPLTT